MNRRTAALLALAAPWLTAQALAEERSKVRSPEIAMLVYPKMTALDLAGPQFMFKEIPGANVHIVGKTLEPVVTDGGLTIVPDSTFETCPKDLTVLFVPGGNGTVGVMRDRRTVAFVADRGASAQYVTSVCLGSLLLAAAGLLRGYRATTHWVALDVLPKFGSTAVRERVVIDRNRITAAGVSAGLDFGLTMVALLSGERQAQLAQLVAEYDPHPPFNAGSPDTAPAAVTDQVRADFATLVAQAERLAR